MVMSHKQIMMDTTRSQTESLSPLEIKIEAETSIKTSEIQQESNAKAKYEDTTSLA
jgi:hypothetical protein